MMRNQYRAIGKVGKIRGCTFVCEILCLLVCLMFLEQGEVEYLDNEADRRHQAAIESRAVMLVRFF